MNERIDAERFRRDFKQLDDSVLLAAEHVAALAGQSKAAIYVMKSRGQMPRPAIERNKLVRWTAGQIRTWIASLAAEAAEAPARGKSGRPRASTHVEST